MPQRIRYKYVGYMGGHVEYPKPLECTVYLYHDRIELENPNLIIPYKRMTNIESADEERISAFRVVMLGILGALLKKKHVYTVIQYKDSVDEKTIVLDFGGKVDEVQRLLYRRMLIWRNSSTRTKAENGYLIYENEQYRFRIKYPETWVKEELEEKMADYMTVVEFRMYVDDEPPFVTIYINNLGTKNMSFQQFIDQEIEDIKNDSKISLVESSNIVISNSDGVKLVDVDSKDNTKRMVVWISSEDKAYEISYIIEERRYMEYLPIIEQMMNSFQIIEGTTKLDGVSQMIKSEDEENPLMILKKRFAKGEINEEEYHRMRRTLESQ